MNVVPLEPVLPEGLRRQLAALPDFAPPEGLRERVAARSWNMPRTAIRAPRVAALAAPVAIAAAAGLLLQRPDPVAVPALAARMAGLERELHALRVAAVAPGPTVVALERELARIDRRLQAAYAAAAPQADLDPLWRDREAVLGQLLLAYRGPDRVIRI
jgi:hypothetical protein